MPGSAMKKILKILSGIIILMLVVKFISFSLAEPWLKKKLIAELDENQDNYACEIKRVHILLIKREIELDGITIYSKKEIEKRGNLSCRIAFIKLRQVKILQAIFKESLSAGELIISSAELKVRAPLRRVTLPSVISPANINIDRIFFEKTDIEIKSTSSAQSFLLKEGDINITNLRIREKDTIKAGFVKQFYFRAKELVSVTADSMYSFRAGNLGYSTATNKLTLEYLNIHPDYKDYNFTSRYEFQTNRFEAGFTDISFNGFDASDFFERGSIVSSFVGIGKMDLTIFRDKRKKFRHMNRPAFQDMIYNYPGLVRIDSIGLKSSTITFNVHAEKANDPGTMTFNKINARIYNITNDTLCKTVNSFFVLKANALLMRKGRIDVFLKGKLFDKDNTFSLEGTLADLDAEELNPILEKNAFIYATSGRIDKMTFSFLATDTKATGKMTLLYHGLNLAVKNKRTDDTIAFRERFISFFANIKVLDSNPIPGEKIREGIIENNRDPERFLFHYCFRSILSGIQTSLVRNQKNNNK
jgi:hypothetical protein